MKYRPEIDGLRAVAVLPVIIYHAMPDWVPGGFLGVDVFFVISGYLITSIIMGDVALGRFSILNFYERRARRILPALFLVLLVCFPVAWLWMLPVAFEKFAASAMSVVLFGSNIFFWLEVDYFDQAAVLKPLLHTWSLAVEEQFYILFPLFISWLWFLGKKTLVGIIVVMALLSLGLAEWGSTNMPVANFFLATGRAWELAFGALCAFEIARRTAQKDNAILAAIGLALILGSLFWFNSAAPMPGLLTLFPVVGVVLVILFSSSANLTGRILSAKALVGVGLISYSAYLWHQPVFAFARLRTFDPISPTLFGLLICLTLVLAFLTWRFVERPFRQRRDRQFLVSRRAIFALSLAGSLAILATAAVFSSGVAKPRSHAIVADMTDTFDGLETARSVYTFHGQCEVWPVRDWQELWDGCDPFENGFSNPDGRTPVPILVVGDSHATGLALGLRANGFEPAQATGLGCSLRPLGMGRNCKAYFDTVKQWVQANDDIEQIWMTNRFQAIEFSETQLRESFEYWTGLGKKVVLFTHMPEFPGRNNLILKSILFDTPVKQTADRSVSSLATEGYVAKLAAEYDVQIINMDQLFCDDADCQFLDDAGQYRTVDYGHLSVEGARDIIHAALEGQFCSGDQNDPKTPLKLCQAGGETPSRN